MTRKVLVELCAGTASVSLWALGRVDPLTGFMGSKRRDRATLVRLLDADRADAVHLVDAGPWGGVWQTLSTIYGRHAVAARLRQWHTLGELPEVWPTLLYEPRASDPYDRAAQYLALQARAAGCIPVWWDADVARWLSPSGGKRHSDRADASGPVRAQAGASAATQRATTPLDKRMSARTPCEPRGLVRIETLAERVEALDAIDWSRVTVHHVDVGGAPVLPGARVYFDPPYRNAPRYAVLLPRDRVLQVAQTHARVADRVVVSEAEPLQIDGWATTPLRAFDEDHGKPEWLTMTAKRPDALQAMVGAAEQRVAAQRLRQPRAQLALQLAQPAGQIERVAP